MKMGLSGRIASKALRIKRQIYYKREELYYHLDLSTEYCIKDKPHNVEFFEGTRSDLESLIECDPTFFSENKVKRFKRRLDAGQRLVLATFEGKIATYAWHSFEEAPLAVGIKIHLEEHQVFFHDFHTFNEFRRRGLYKDIIFESVRLAKKEGYMEIHATHLKNNFISQKVFRQIGYKLIKKYTLTRFFNKNFIKQKKVS